MPEFRGGSQLVVEFIIASGTVNPSTQFRTVNLKSETDALDSTAGTVQWREFIAGLTQWNVSYEGLHNGTASPMGTADIAALRLGAGTIRISPFGTATGQQKISGGGLVTAVEVDLPYDDVATVKVDWQGSGTLTEGVW